MGGIANRIGKHLQWIKSAIVAKLQSRVKYRIVDFCDKTCRVSFQCNITRACFSKPVISAILDTEILGQLLPEQACFLGLVASKGIRQNKIQYAGSRELMQGQLILQCAEGETDKPDLIFDRYGNFIFLHPKTKKRCVMRPEYVISQEKLINLFHPSVACAIGFQVGFKRRSSSRKDVAQDARLTLVKNG